ncbi:hypothetical protein Tco_1229831 [Tanacetum coccineum]
MYTILNDPYLEIGIKELVMSSASSAVTYTSVYTDSEPGRVFWRADEEISDGGVPQLQDFFTTSRLYFTTLLISQLSNTTWCGFLLQMGFTIILATLNGLDVGLLGDVIGEDDYDDE